VGVEGCAHGCTPIKRRWYGCADVLRQQPRLTGIASSLGAVMGVVVTLVTAHVAVEIDCT
jgi:hypothetical protein